MAAALRECAWEQKWSQLAWVKAGRALRMEDQAYAFRLAEMAKKHSSEAFYVLDDPLKAAIFSVLAELMREMETLANKQIKRYLKLLPLVS